MAYFKNDLWPPGLSTLASGYEAVFIVYWAM
jgi:hypothetical protein